MFLSSGLTLHVPCPRPRAFISSLDDRVHPSVVIAVNRRSNRTNFSTRLFVGLQKGGGRRFTAVLIRNSLTPPPTYALTDRVLRSLSERELYVYCEPWYERRSRTLSWRGHVSDRGGHPVPRTRRPVGSDTRCPKMQMFPGTTMAARKRSMVLAN